MKRGLVGAPGRRFRITLEDVEPDKAFPVYGGDERYPAKGGVEVVGLHEMAEGLAGLR